MAPSHAATLAEKAKETGCINKPAVVEGETYRCMTKSGAAYFNVPGVRGTPEKSERQSGMPTGFPKVDAGTQKGRDDLRRKVLNEELAIEEKLLAEVRLEYGNGAPPATPDEQAIPQKYAERLARLRQAVSLHEKNIAALKKELTATR
ncbi:MAG TPA: hypothetical protein VG429_12350 [Casimicrobiaceae bacterium]|jgi:hypothetical protein|nr:hypothetical protein [Casimicrobiaceae bacterium]